MKEKSLKSSVFFRGKSSKRIETCPNYTKNCTVSKKEEILSNNRNHLKDLLVLIKNVQLAFLSGTITKNKAKFISNHLAFKIILNEFKEKLSEKFNEKLYEFNNLKTGLITKHQDIKNSAIYNKNKTLNFPSDINKGKNENFDEEEDELDKLKSANFMLKNEIEEISFFIERKKEQICYAKEYSSFYHHNKEIICNPKKDNCIVFRLLHKQLIETRKKFTKAVSKKTIQNLGISDYSHSIEIMKDLIENAKHGMKYIDTEQIIPEVSKDYTVTINNALNQTLNTIAKNFEASHININEEFNNITFNNINSNNIINQITKKRNSFGNNNILPFNQIDINELQKFLQLNMNINVNINVNNQCDKNSCGPFENIKSNKEKENEIETEKKDRSLSELKKRKNNNFSPDKLSLTMKNLHKKRNKKIVRSTSEKNEKENNSYVISRKTKKRLSTSSM